MHVDLGRRVRARRSELQLTQLELADRAGVGLSTVIRIERGETTQMRTLTKIAEVLETPLSELVAEAS